MATLVKVNQNPKLMQTENKTNDLDLFLGIDVHKKSWKVAFYTKNSMVKTLSMEPDAQKLRNYLDKNFKDWTYYSVYEAGFCGFSVHRALTKQGINNIVINPADVPTSDKEDKRKSDQIDCKKLARCLRNNELEGIYIPSEKLESDRQLVRLRNRFLKKDYTRHINRLKNHLKQKGVSEPEGMPQRWSTKYENWVASLKLPNENDTVVKDALLAEIRKNQAAVKDVEAKIRNLAKTPDYKKQVELLTSTPGIGVLSAMTILTEIGDINRFKNIDQLCSFIGLMPNSRGSGEKEYIGKRTERGNDHLLWVLDQCAWRIKFQDPQLLKKFQTHCQQMSPSKAIVRIMKSLASRIKHILTHEEPYKCGV